MSHFHFSDLEQATFSKSDGAHLQTISPPTLPPIWPPIPANRTHMSFDDPAIPFRYDDDPVLPVVQIEPIAPLANSSPSITIHPNHPTLTPAILPANNPAPRIPAAKDAAPNASRIAGRCHDRGPQVDLRFKCEFQDCRKEFRRRYNLKVHMRRHTGETPYTCKLPGCGKKYRWRSSMAHHLKVHEGVNQADVPIDIKTENIPVKFQVRQASKLPQKDVIRKDKVVFKSEPFPYTAQCWEGAAMATVNHVDELPTSPVSSNTLDTEDSVQLINQPHPALETRPVWNDRLNSISTGCNRIYLGKSNANTSWNGAAAFLQNQDSMTPGETGIVAQSSGLYISDVTPRREV